jgi:hypothetical protein
MRKSSGAITLAIVVILFTVTYALFPTFQSFITSNIALLTFLGVLITVFSLLYSMLSQPTIPANKRRVKEPTQELEQMEASQSSISTKRILMVIAILGIIIGIVAYQGGNHIDTLVTSKRIPKTSPPKTSPPTTSPPTTSPPTKPTWSDIAFEKRVINRKDYDTFEWAIFPRLTGDGKILVIGQITIGWNSGAYRISFRKSRPIVIDSIEAGGSARGTNITEDGENTIIELYFVSTMPSPFYLQFERLNEVQSYNEVNYVDWNFSTESNYVYTTFVVPKGHELLYTSFREGTIYYAADDSTVVRFEAVDPGNNGACGIVFSERGLRLSNEAEEYFRIGEYAKAKQRYENALAFYNDLPDTLDRSLEWYSSIKWYKWADKADHLSEMLNKCDEYQRIKSDAETKYTEASSLFGDGKYKEAKAKFEDALTLFDQLDNQDMAQECKEHISTCERKIKLRYMIYCTMIFGVTIIIIVAIYYYQRTKDGEQYRKG